MGNIDNIMEHFAGMFNIILIPFIFAYIIPKINIQKWFFVFISVFIIIWILSLNVNPYDLKANNKYSILKNIDQTYLPKNEFIKKWKW